ncbi:hypothetical protein EXIGLDRAFT_255837 [Exidia glandulosa HHB12029]|uniref:Uncharacterized protein n=1 Tax=Exidia glandulosa HHB12029 TaxID=1314781 RepID=A0A165DVT2_EXIGL|nr:hypothetical protein EXIGLDRAFT_255837 [Exidia glandulosa HHB12029]
MVVVVVVVVVLPGLFVLPSEMERYRHNDLEAAGDAYDDSNPDDTTVMEAALFLHDDHLRATEPFMSAKERSIVTSALATARTLHNAHAATVTVPSLPHLHTLEMGDFVYLTKDWHMPRLRVFHLSCRTSRLDLWPDEAADHTEALAIRGQFESLRAVTYYQDGSDVSEEPSAMALLALLPNLEYFGFQPYELDPDNDSTVINSPFQHPRLREIDMCGRWASDAWTWLPLIADNYEQGRLPNLHVCRVLHWNHPIDTEPEFLAAKTRLDGLGIRLEGSPGGLISTRHGMAYPISVARACGLVPNLLTRYSIPRPRLTVPAHEFSGAIQT